MSDTLKFMHCADIHLDSPFTLSSPDEARKRRMSLRSSFASAVLYAKSEGCKLFLIAGDLFNDVLVTKDTIEMLVNEISSFPSCQFVVSPGNHDVYYEKSPYVLVRWPENFHIFKTPEYEYIDIPDTNVRVYGRAFTATPPWTDPPLAGFHVHDESKVNILVSHGELSTGYSPFCPYYEKDMALSGFDYIALGHIHKASGLKYAGKTAYAYPGCLEGRGFDETGYKGAIIGEISKDKLEIKPVRFSSKRYEIVQIDVSGASTLSSCAAKISEECSSYGEDTALRVVLEGVTSPEFSADESNLRGLVPKPYYLELKDNTLPLLNADFLKNDNTIIGEFYRNLEPKITSEDAKERELARMALKYGLKALFSRELE